MRYLMPMHPAAGYFILSNNTGHVKILTKASAKDCQSLMFHRSVEKDGEEMMLPVSRVTVPAHGSVSFAPGGYHLMCMGPSPAVRPGKSVKITLGFADGSAVSADFPIKGANAQ